MILMPSCHMDKEALVTIQDAYYASLFVGWEAFVNTWEIRFGPTTYVDPMEVLSRLKQTSNVATYKSQFEALSNKIT